MQRLEDRSRVDGNVAGECHKARPTVWSTSAR